MSSSQIIIKCCLFDKLPACFELICSSRKFFYTLKLNRNVNKMKDSESLEHYTTFCVRLGDFRVVLISCVLSLWWSCCLGGLLMNSSSDKSFKQMLIKVATCTENTAVG